MIHDFGAHVMAGGLAVFTPDCEACAQCEYIFSGKTVTARCGMVKGHGGSHGQWRDPVSGEKV